MKSCKNIKTTNSFINKKNIWINSYTPNSTEKKIRKYNINEKNILSELSSKSDTFSNNNNYKSFFDFDIEEIYFFINEEELILNVSQNFENEKLCKVIKSIYINIIKLTNKLNKNNKNSIQFNNFYMNKFKLVYLSLKNINISVLCLFDIIIKNSIIKFFMIYILLSLLNFLNINVDFTNQSFIIDKIIYSKIYESFMVLPLIRFFYLLSENIFNKHTFFFKDMEYKNFYLINLDENYTNIFSFNNLHNNLSKKIQKNNIIWNELLFHSQNLKKMYINNLGKISDKEYQNYFVKIEYKSCLPYIIFVIRFLPLLDGIVLIHEYEPKKKNTNNKFKNTNEFDIIYGTDNIVDVKEERCICESKIFKEREYFIFGFLLCSVPSFNFFYEIELNIYYSEQILHIIINIVDKSSLDSSFNVNYILSKILYKLYNEYLKCNIQELDNHRIIRDNENENKFKSKKDLLIRNEKIINKINDNKNEIIDNNKQWNYSNYYKNKNLFKMTKIYYLLSLFKPTNNISRFKNYNNINKEDYDSNKYEYINIDLKKSLHKSVNVTMKFSGDIFKNNENLKNNNQNINLSNLLTKPISNYDGETNLDYFSSSTNNISSDFNKTQSDDTIFTFKKNSLFDLKSFSIKKK